ncbi:MAG: PLDc_N domain-containing protein [Desulfovibrionaceae bacterium]|nr:PLDc_N domain-containing protein [Desulfovibrionaceae bacterium]MBF0514819.1 PLDc_N domain-containing protein [Desulfovibrionaceae bacterium]
MEYLSSLPATGLAVFFALAAIPIIPNLYAIRHAMLHHFATQQEKMLWIGAAVFIPVLGGLAYVFFGRRRAAGKMF